MVKYKLFFSIKSTNKYSYRQRFLGRHEFDVKLISYERNKRKKIVEIVLMDNKIHIVHALFNA